MGSSRPSLKYNSNDQAWEVLGKGGTKIISFGDSWIAKGKGDHLYLNTSLPSKTVRLNSRTYVATASIVGFQSSPRAGIDMISDIIGAEIGPGINAGFKSSAGVLGLKASTNIKATCGSLGGQLRCFEADMGSDTGYANTVKGPACNLRSINNLHGNVTGGVYLIYATTHGGNKAWNGFAALPNSADVNSGLAYVGSVAGGDAYVRVLIGSTNYALLAKAFD